MEISRKIKTIKIDANKCASCRACEAICSAFHANPKYAIVNPKHSRIRVYYDESNDIYVPDHTSRDNLESFELKRELCLINVEQTTDFKIEFWNSVFSLNININKTPENEPIGRFRLT